MKTVLESDLGRGAFAAGIVQGAADLLFHPELDARQRVGRFLLAAVVGVGAALFAAAVVAALPIVISGGTAAVTNSVVAAGIGILFDHFVTRPYIYRQSGLGH